MNFIVQIGSYSLVNVSDDNKFVKTLSVHRTHNIYRGVRAFEKEKKIVAFDLILSFLSSVTSIC